MARNHEKAQAMLNRWQRIKRDVEKETTVRPYLASECKTLPAAEQWRTDVIKEISRKVSEIQNASLGEYRIRELNDQINKLLREKRHWEKRILELGGPDYMTKAKQDAQFEGAEAQGSMGYKYFGAAKDLPGVRELFEKAPAGPAKRTRYEMHKGVTPDYYGYRDDDDGVLERYEKKAEAKIRKKVVQEWHKQQAQKQEATSADVTAMQTDITTEEEQAGFSSLVQVPTQAQMAETLLVLKKKQLIEKLGLRPKTSATSSSSSSTNSTADALQNKEATNPEETQAGSEEEEEAQAEDGTTQQEVPQEMNDTSDDEELDAEAEAQRRQEDQKLDDVQQEIAEDLSAEAGSGRDAAEDTAGKNAEEGTRQSPPSTD